MPVKYYAKLLNLKRKTKRKIAPEVEGDGLLDDGFGLHGSGLAAADLADVPDNDEVDPDGDGVEKACCVRCRTPTSKCNAATLVYSPQLFLSTQGVGGLRLWSLFPQHGSHGRGVNHI